jgi:hypothetical protein
MLEKKAALNSAPKRPKLKDWQSIYIKNHLALDVITTVNHIFFRLKKINFKKSKICIQIPFESIVVPSWGAYLIIIRILRMAKLPTANNLAPKLHIEKRFKNLFGISSLIDRILMLGFGLFGVLHLNACAIFWAGRIGGFYNWPKIFLIWGTYAEMGIDVIDVNPWTLYTWCLYTVNQCFAFLIQYCFLNVILILLCIGRYAFS